MLLTLSVSFLRYGVREPSPHKYRHLLNQQPAASVGSVHDVVAWGDAIILAVPGAFSEAEIKELADSLGPGVRGKVVIDATNALTDYPKVTRSCGWYNM